MPMNSHLSQAVAQYDAEASGYDREYFSNFGFYHAVTLDNVRRCVPERRDKPIPTAIARVLAKHNVAPQPPPRRRPSVPSGQLPLPVPLNQSAATRLLGRARG